MGSLRLGGAEQVREMLSEDSHPGLWFGSGPRTGGRTCPREEPRLGREMLAHI